MRLLLHLDSTDGARGQSLPGKRAASEMGSDLLNWGLGVVDRETGKEPDPETRRKSSESSLAIVRVIMDPPRWVALNNGKRFRRSQNVLAATPREHELPLILGSLLEGGAALLPHCAQWQAQGEGRAAMAGMVENE